jgi:anti-anti-sigma regulatory factor
VKHFIVKYDVTNNVISLPPRIDSTTIGHFAGAIVIWQLRKKYEPVTFDFSGVQKPYSSGMLPIISLITYWRSLRTVIIRLPQNPSVKKIFKITNWSHYLDPESFEIEAVSVSHVVTRQFINYTHLPPIIHNFMEVVLTNMRIPADLISGLEWSVNEICDNVINHSDSNVGGFVELVTFPTEKMITFTVSDAGKGIRKSLREGFPGIKSCSQAITEAIKVGVTRNPQAGQGNGLAGSFNIATMAGGSLDIISGNGRLLCLPNETRVFEDPIGSKFYKGTSVSGVLRMSDNFSIKKALFFNGIGYSPLNIIDLLYENQGGDFLTIIMKDERSGFGTRSSGKQLRTKMINLLKAKPMYVIRLDWEGVTLISSSFGDEFLGKLYLEIGEIEFKKRVSIINVSSLVQDLLNKAISERISQNDRKN